jgi:hypothetical protein
MVVSVCRAGKQRENYQVRTGFVRGRRISHSLAVRRVCIASSDSAVRCDDTAFKIDLLVCELSRIDPFAAISQWHLSLRRCTIHVGQEILSFRPNAGLNGRFPLRTPIASVRCPFSSHSGIALCSARTKSLTRTS